MTKQAYGKVVWTLFFEKQYQYQYYRMWVIQDKDDYLFHLTKRTAPTEEWEILERCTAERAKWWTKIMFSSYGAEGVPVG